VREWVREGEWVRGGGDEWSEVREGEKGVEFMT
jgi:hypothetical protein